ncbi:superinfection immunity protein [Simiduia agarivorans]|uniref:Superinfection immunity protein n=1 Tax=Simiduia agarivorans (strain DSM 21679 / JCM 13881 / BCRC 17597 / SA1) TaxID=1117647 RepID=K4KLR2_SIMAS|nr:superinfection immunity protein [Simiduia agarivorans]AFU99976.1 hypothetical protein M5M_14200 [Simiduia agarivorans SA1 = DSM 21679]
MDFITTLTADAGPLGWAVLIPGVVLLWFLPALLALAFNPSQARLIALACVPAGLSFVAWGALFVWAITGRVADRFLQRTTR